MGKGKRFSVLIMGLLSLLPTALGQAPVPVGDPIASKLEEAKKVYKEEVEKSRTLIIKALEQADESAREAADVGLVKTIKAERAEFEASGKPPQRALTAEYTKQRETFRKAMFDAYTQAIRDYLKARKDDQAQKINDERSEFQRNKIGDDPGKRDAPAVPDFGVARFGSGSESIHGVDVKIGDPQFTLIWDSNADLDLHVIEPGGKEIFWNERKGKLGGELDVDNVEGYGPENIYWMKQNEDGSRELGPGPTGEYRWFVQYYGGNRGVPVVTNWKVRVKHDGKVEVFQGRLTAPGARSKTYPLQVEPPKKVQ